MANAAWLALAVMAHKPRPRRRQLAGADLQRATAATLRRTVLTIPGWLVRTGRRRHLRLPARWPLGQAIAAPLGRIQKSPLHC